MKSGEPRAVVVVVDLAFGDCGKGTVVDFLTRHHAADTVVRFNGGPQAGHNVVTPDGRHHTFSQFGSGTLVPGTRTLLSRFMLVEPYAMLNEAAHLAGLGVRNPLTGLLIDRRCTVITPAHQAANRIRELARGSDAHGTCGVGVGETMQDTLEHPDLTLRAADLGDRHTLRTRLRAFCDLKLGQLRHELRAVEQHPAAALAMQTLSDPSWIDAAIDNYTHVGRHVTLVDHDDVRSVLRAPGTTIFEGAQGVLLDQWYGFHPHTTWSTTTSANAETLLAESDERVRPMRLGVLRAYFTRHGAGPFVTADESLAPLLPEPHNTCHGWQGRFRVGVFDTVAARYALTVTGAVDALAFTHLDRLPQLPRALCTAYESSAGRITDIPLLPPGDFAAREQLTATLLRCRPVLTDYGNAAFHEILAHELRTPIHLTSSGPTHDDKQITPSRRT
jgi:adenylosuccinate synthase